MDGGNFLQEGALSIAILIEERAPLGANGSQFCLVFEKNSKTLCD